MKTHESLPERRWLIVVRCDKAGSMVAKNVMGILEKISIGKPHLAFNSKDASVVGMYAKIAKPVGVIRTMLEPISDTYDRGFVLVLEVGELWGALGNNTGYVWLQQNKD